VEQINSILSRLRERTPNELAGYRVEKFDDLERPTDGLPPTNGVRFTLEGQIRIIVRPSGTEPKVKCYLEVIADDENSAKQSLDAIEEAMRGFLVA
jgi:phosphomannomutase